MAEEKKETPVLDPIAYRSSYRPEDIKEDWKNDPNIPGIGPTGANEHFREYGDDSDPAWQSIKGGMADKYEGEGVKNSYIDYDPNVTTKDLDPNYTYGREVSTKRAGEEGYIAKRNDMIASALYNEGKVSKEDVANYLSAQKGWFDSTEADRLNTIESVWKRLGQYTPKEEQQYDESKADSIVKDNSGEIFGKTTAEEGNPKEGIQTLADENSPYTAMEEARANNLKNLLGMPSEDIATALDAGALPGTLQSIRDLQQFYPEKRQEVQQYQKKLRTQNTVTSIANGTEIDTENNGQSVINNANADFANSNAGAIKTSQEITQDVNNALASNQTANEASETMASIEEDMAILKNRLKNLKLEASKAFKGDVPDYLVNAYIANKSQEIQNQIQILEDRYNMAYNRYKTEVANTQWEKEFELKQQELQLRKDSAALEDWATRQNVAINWYKAKGQTSGGTDTNGYELSTMSDEQIGDMVDLLMTQYNNGQLGDAQCATGVQRYYLPMLGISLPNLSDYQNKLKLINEGKSYTPKKGDLIIFSDYGSKFGHMGIVVGVDEFGDGSISYLDWNGSVDANGNGTEKVQARNIKANDKKIMGYRNINKGQGQTSGGTVKEWEDTDYTNFTNFLDSNNKDISNTDRASIAEMYGFKDNLSGMRDFATEQLKNRETTETPETETKTNEELGYDEEKGYNEVDSKFYQQYFNNRLYTIENLAKDTGTTVDEARKRARTWKLRMGKSVSDKISDGLNDSQKALLKKVVEGDMKPTEELAETLGFGGDLALLGEAMNEVAKDEGQVEIDNALRTLAELQIVFEDSGHFDDGEFDRSIWGATVPWSNRKLKMQQLKAQLKLDKVRNSRKQGVTYGSMTEAEWEMLEKAISSLTMRKMNDEEFTKEIKNIIAYLWSASYGDPSKKGAIQGPTSAQWSNYVKQVRKSATFDIYSSLDTSNEARREAFDEASKGAESDDANDWMNE